MYFNFIINLSEKYVIIVRRHKKSEYRKILIPFSQLADVVKLLGFLQIVQRSRFKRGHILQKSVGIELLSPYVVYNNYPLVQHWWSLSHCRYQDL